MKRLGWALGFLLALCATGPAAAASWAFGHAPPRLFLADGEEDLQFLAQCDDGVLAVIYMAPDRTDLAAGTARDCEAARPCRDRAQVTLLVDGQSEDILASAEPEEMYGGYEIHFQLKPGDSLWARMAKGRALALRIDGKTGETLSLKGIARPLGQLLAACRG